MTAPAAGRHLLQIPGPTNVPDRVVRAMARPLVDHRSAEFARLTGEVLEGLRAVLRTSGPVVLYTASGTGAWEAALVNTLSPGDRVLVVETGFFAAGWGAVAGRLGLEVEVVETDWRHPADAAEVERRLAADREHRVRAVLIVHNETSTGVTSDVPAIRAAIDRAGHPALLLVDTISSLASIDYRHDEWGVDVTVGASQKGLMLPPGLSLNAVSEKALAAARTARLPASYWQWEPMLAAAERGFFPWTPATSLLFGLREALAMLAEAGLEATFARHDRHAAATRAAVGAWGLDLLCADPAAYSSSLTAVLVPEGADADALRATVLERSDMSLGAGLGRLAGRVFRIGHLGDLNDLMLVAAIGGVELGLRAEGLIGEDRRGVDAALDILSDGDEAHGVG